MESTRRAFADLSAAEKAGIESLLDVPFGPGDTITVTVERAESRGLSSPVEETQLEWAMCNEDLSDNELDALEAQLAELRSARLAGVN